MRPDLEIIKRGETDVIDAVIDYLWALPRGESNFVTMIIPEHFRRRSLAKALRRHRVLPEASPAGEPGCRDHRRARDHVGSDPNGSPQRAVCRILVSGAHAASMRAANYARTLGIPDTRAVFFAFDAEEAERGPRSLGRTGDAGSARDRGGARSGTSANRCSHTCARSPPIPSARRSDHARAHFQRARTFTAQQRALYIKRLLLFEPRVILSSVPYRLD